MALGRALLEPPTVAGAAAALHRVPVSALAGHLHLGGHYRCDARPKIRVGAWQGCKEGSISFLKKRNKKLLLIFSGVRCKKAHSLLA
jgi:hypothetical protein